MRSVAIINQKGGVGKTTTAVNLAAGLARFGGQQVLLVDLDPQAHATLHLGVEVGPQDKSLYDVLAGEAMLAEAARPVSERLTLVPANIDLVATEVELGDRDGRERALARALETQAERFDMLLVDCPPSLGILTVNALAAADEILIPLQAHFFSLQGLGRLLETVAVVRRRVHARVRVTGIVLCMYEQTTRLAQEVADEIRRFLERAGPQDVWHGARLFETRIRRNIKLAESPSFGKSIFDYDASSNGAADYLALTHEFLGRPLSGVPTPGPGEPRIVQAAAAPLEHVVPGAERGQPAAPGTPRSARDTEPPAAVDMESIPYGEST